MWTLLLSEKETVAFFVFMKLKEAHRYMRLFLCACGSSSCKRARLLAGNQNAELSTHRYSVLSFLDFQLLNKHENFGNPGSFFGIS